MSLKRLPNGKLTEEQGQWLEEERKRTGNTATAIIRQLIDKERKKGRK